MTRSKIPFTKPMIFGHRGYSSLEPENTLPSFLPCIEKHIRGAELDVQLCKTGELVVVHDANMKRVSGRDALVSDLTLEELGSLDVDKKHQGPL
ncbi:MAG TPA: hypothetical protein DCG32_08140 [Sphaerochaeta sp.]|nr:hypothetical protein [Sphaerochaeta sp.]